MSLVEDLSPNLTGKQRRHLRSLGHPLKPIVQVGQKGVSDGLIENLQQALLDHELVKVKVHDSDEMEPVAQELHARTDAQLAQKIGKILLFYKPHPEDPTIRLPKATDE